MAGDAKAKTIKKEAKSKLWKIPPYPGPEKGARPKTQTPSRKQEPRSAFCGKNTLLPGGSSPSDSSSSGSSSSDSSSDSSGNSDSSDSSDSPAQRSIAATAAAPTMAPTRPPKTPAAAPKILSTLSTGPRNQTPRHSKPDQPGAPTQLPLTGQSSPFTGRDGSGAGTKALFTFGREGKYTNPSYEAVENRMECLYPRFRHLLHMVRDDHGSQHQGHTRITHTKARAIHVKEVWSLVSSVMKDLDAKKLARPNYTVDIDRDCVFGVRVNYQMNLLQAAKKFSGAGPASAGGAQDAAETDKTGQAVKYATHEEMLAYKILTLKFAYPNWMVTILFGAEHEYLMYPVSPAGTGGPGMMANGAEKEIERRFAEREAKQKQAELKVQQRQEAFEAETKRAELEARQERTKIISAAREKLKKIEDRAAFVEELAVRANRAIKEGQAHHDNQQRSLQSLLQELERWRHNGRNLIEADKQGGQAHSQSSSGHGQYRWPNKRHRS